MRGAPGGDDYQKIWINPNNPQHPPRRLRSGRRRLGQSRRDRGATGTRSRRRRCITSRPTTRFPYRVCGGQQDSGSACVDSRVDGRRDHVPRLASGEHPGVRHRRARSEGSGPRLRQRAHERVAATTGRTGADDARRPRHERRAAPNGESFNRNVRTMPINWSPVDPNTLFYASNAVWKIDQSRRTAGRASAAISRGRRGPCRRTPASTRARVTPAPLGSDHRALAVAARRQRALGRHRRRQHPGDDRRRREVDERHAAADQAVDAHLQHRRRPLRHADRRTPPRTRCASTT